MTDDDFTPFASMLTGISDYYSKPLSGMVIDLYWRGLQQYDLAAIRQAFAHIMYSPGSDQRHRSYMPRVDELKTVLEGSRTDQSSLAWSKLHWALRCVGSWTDVVFDDPLIHRVIEDMGGWIRLCGQPDKEAPFLARDFQNRYQGYRMRPDPPAYPRVLVGTANDYNRRHGYALEPARMVGDEQRCRLVYAGGHKPALPAMLQPAYQALPRLETAS